MSRCSSRWRLLLRAFEDLAERYGYDLALTPAIEGTELFARGVGEATEVVEKQMYTFEDQGGRSVTLRPEFTAGIVRAYVDGLDRFIVSIADTGIGISEQDLAEVILPPDSHLIGLDF